MSVSFQQAQLAGVLVIAAQGLFALMGYCPPLVFPYLCCVGMVLRVLHRQLGKSLLDEQRAYLDYQFERLQAKQPPQRKPTRRWTAASLDLKQAS